MQIGSHAFTYDYVYGGSSESPSSTIYNDCVAPLVDALFHGYNATVLAYGQVYVLHMVLTLVIRTFLFEKLFLLYLVCFN